MADAVIDSSVSQILNYIEDNRLVLNSRLSNYYGAGNAAYSIHKTDSAFLLCKLINTNLPIYLNLSVINYLNYNQRCIAIIFRI
jgi:hypothetical protein